MAEHDGLGKVKKNLARIISFPEDASGDGSKDKMIRLMRRGNSAILYSLRAARELGVQKVLIPDQGGWLTYQQFPEKLNMEKLEIETEDSLVKLDVLENVLEKNPGSVLILNSLAGYFVPLPVKEIYSLCRKHDVLFINDVSGSIGVKELADINHCDMMVCSFRKWKPVNLGEGGFFSAKDKRFLYQDVEDVELDHQVLNTKLKELPRRLELLYKEAAKIKKDLDGYNILHKDAEGINVVVAFEDEIEKRRIIAYCDSRELQYTICPRYIRVNRDAISIEVKRL